MDSKNDKTEGTVDPQDLRDLAAFMVQAGRPVDADIVRAAADTIDALTEKALIVEADANVHIDRLIGERDEARAEVARLREEEERLQSIIARASVRETRLRDALDYYSSEDLYRGHDPAVLLDAGVRARAALGDGTGWGCRECGAPRATEQGGRCRTCEKYGETP